jgi:hypothetical protein
METPNQNGQHLRTVEARAGWVRATGRGSGARTAETEAAHHSRSDPTFLEDKLPTSHSHKDPLHRQEVSVAVVLIVGDTLEAYIVGGQRRGGEQGRREVWRALPDLRT